MYSTYVCARIPFITYTLCLVTLCYSQTTTVILRFILMMGMLIQNSHTSGFFVFHFQAII